MKQEIAAKIKERRKKLGLTQTQLAKRVGLSKTQIVNYEQGRGLGLAPLYKITKKLGLKINVKFVVDKEKCQL